MTGRLLGGPFFLTSGIRDRWLRLGFYLPYNHE